jgi:HEPN domain-containing protein
MSPGPYADERDKIDRAINTFSTESFRDQADRDYIAARLACRYELIPQFLWAAHQAVEKYLKGILLYNRIKATKVGHDLSQAMLLTKRLPFTIGLSRRSEAFIAHLSTYGQFRYLEIPYHVNGHVLVDLDLTVWEIRRYCQVLDVFGKKLPEKEELLLASAKAALARSDQEPRYKLRLHGGLLEKILASRKHPSRAALLWNNPCYGVRKRASFRARDLLHGQNPTLYLYPEILDDLLDYVFVPPKLVKAYREHLAEVQAGKKERP